MKKIISLLLAVLMLVSVVSLVGCGEAKKSSEPVKFGLGLYSSMSKAVSADGDTQGIGEAAVTAAAVILDADGKILDCAIDTADNTVNFTSDGKAVKANEFKTKYELGDSYGMKAYGGAKKEWYEQIDAFVSLVKGKTYDEVKALVGKENKGTDEVISAGCTITVSEYVLAIEKAVKNAKDSKAAADNNVKLGIISTQIETKDATEDAKGKNGFDITVSAAALGSDGKVNAMATDAVSVEFAFDTKGTTDTDTSAELKSKREAGDNYGMSAYGQDLNGDGTVKEWYAQADAFDAACIGKNSDEISKLALDTGYGTDDIQKAGCTINISDMVKSAVKASK